MIPSKQVEDALAVVPTAPASREDDALAMLTGDVPLVPLVPLLPPLVPLLPPLVPLLPPPLLPELACALLSERSVGAI